jgi:hypothetical protein
VDESFEALLSILTSVRNALMQRRVGAFVDQVNLENGERQSAEVMVSYADRIWTVTPTSGGRIEYRNGKVEEAPRDRDDYLPPEVALFYPLSMRIWGGIPDNYRVTGAQTEDEGVRLALAAIEDPHETGSAFVNTKYGVMTEYLTPARTYTVRDLSWLPRL